ncbi:hypothetical protein OAL67_00390 [bacterium]|nr:hypothetical protein [bacterium]
MKLVAVLPSELYRIEKSPHCASLGIEDRGFTTTRLLNFLRDFHGNISKARKRLKIDNVRTLPQGKITTEHISSITSQLTRKQVLAIFQESEYICEKYKLTDNWQDSIEVLLLTNVFLVPYKDLGIKVHVPDNLYTVQGKNKLRNRRIKSISTGGIDRLLEMEDVLNYPAIYFTRFIEPTNLAKWINRKGKHIEVLFQNLPKPRKKRVKTLTLAVGHLVYVLHDVAGYSPKDIVKFFSEMYEEGDELSELLDEKSYSDLSDYRRKFMKHLESITR